MKKRFFVKPLHKMVTTPPFMKSLFIFFPTIFWSKKKMILKVVWRVLMGVLRVLEGCFRVFEVCLEGVWKNKIEVWNQSDPPPPLTKSFHKKSFFSRMRASLSWQFWAHIYILGASLCDAISWSLPLAGRSQPGQRPRLATTLCHQGGIHGERLPGLPA